MQEWYGIEAASHHPHSVCIVDPCLSISCPFGKHCVALDELNTTCESDCPHSNCSGTATVVPDVDPCVLSNPCQNDGRCYVDAGDEVSCRCPFNFRGRFCDSQVDMCTQFRCGLLPENFYYVYIYTHSL